MKIIITATLSLICSCSISIADECRDRFISIVTDGTSKGPIKTLSTTKIEGGMDMSNYFYQTEDGHWMSEVIEPKDSQWSLGYNNNMYSSSDKGKSWKKIREWDSKKQRIETYKNLIEETKSTKNANCGEEKINGELFDWVEGEYDSITKYHYLNKYWVNRKTGWVAKAEYKITGSGYNSTITQTIEKSPDLTLPTPN